jgi:hypothetical protein
LKIVDAFWEKRNLGASTTEFTVEDNDTVHSINDVLVNCCSEYQVLRLPYHQTYFLFPIQDLGFRFVEDMFALKNDLKPIVINPIVERLYKEISYNSMKKEDIEQLLKEVDRGMFNSDRVFIDPFFDNTLARRRYYNWLKDELERGSLFFKYMYKGKTVGFNALKDKGQGVYDAYLGGLYSEYQKSGLGSAIFVSDIVKDLGGKCVVTNVSSNNMKQVKNLLQKGFVITSSYHVFVKHLNR